MHTRTTDELTRLEESNCNYGVNFCSITSQDIGAVTISEEINNTFRWCKLEWGKVHENASSTLIIVSLDYAILSYFACLPQRKMIQLKADCTFQNLDSDATVSDMTLW